jgi:hypothetical protein
MLLHNAELYSELCMYSNVENLYRNLHYGMLYVDVVYNP